MDSARQPDDSSRVHGRLAQDVALHADIDARLADAWLGFWGTAGWEPETVSAFMRWSYGQGYSDCLTEPVRGTLLRDHGLAVPKRERREDIDKK
jgi:hypothetical protein